MLSSVAQCGGIAKRHFKSILNKNSNKYDLHTGKVPPHPSAIYMCCRIGNQLFKEYCTNHISSIQQHPDRLSSVIIEQSSHGVCQSNRSQHGNDIVNEDVIRDHLEKPFHCGTIKDASIIWSKRNPACGDEVTLSLRISQETIIEAWHQVRGCMLCKAAASILCEHLQNVPVLQAQEISDADVIEWTGITISPGRRGCCALPVWTLRELLQNEIETRAS